MRILFLTHYFPPEGNAPASRTYEMCKRWVRDGHDVTVITCAPNQPDGVVYEGYRNRLLQREVVDGIKTVRVWTYLAANKGTMRRIMNFVSYMFSATAGSLFVRRPDIVIATSPQFFCGWAGTLVSWVRWRRFILEIRDLWPESIVAAGAISNRRVLRLLEWLERRLYKSATHIVTVGEGYKRRLLEKDVPESKLSIVTNGADLDVFKPREPDSELVERYGLAGKYVCSYIGTIGMCSGLDVVLRAATILKQRGDDTVRFMLVGDGAVREDLVKQASEQGLGNVIFTGRQPKELMPNFQSVTDVCLAHLIKDDLFTTVLPSKIFEAAAMCKPIILGVAGSAAELVTQANSGICIEPENEHELLEAIERLRNDPDLARQYGGDGREYIAAHFDRDTLAQDYLKVIERVLDGGDHPSACVDSTAAG